MKTFYVTTPIYYANSLPHLGSLYTTLVADALKRYKKQRGYETFFLTGMDEHGVNVQRAAERAGLPPKEFVDRVAETFQRTFAAFGLDGAHGGYDIFMRTTAPFHYAGVQEFWRRVARARTPKGNAAIYKGHYEGWFCAACASYKTEDEYIKPQRPDDAPRCLVHETPLDRVSEESYFFRLSDYGEALLDLYERQPNFIWPEERRNEVISFVRAGLQDLSVSRLKSSVAWAIPVPDDPEHTVYVWFDALTNYITAIGFGNEERERAAGFEKFWPAVHLVGKDILRFHAVYWPAFLMAAGLKQPRAIVAHGMWLDRDGRKMSKTLGNTIDLEVLHRHFSNDVVRYFCLREMVFGQDGRFSYEAVIERANSDLASGLGNLVSRTLTMIARYCAGEIPSPEISEANYLQAKRAGVNPDPSDHASALELARDQFVTHFDEYSFSRALESVWNIIARTDKLISEAKPWELVKDERQRETLNAVLYRAAETLRWLAVLLHPVMPDATRRIWRQLGLTGDPAENDPARLAWGELAAGTRIGEIEAIFPRIERKRVMAEIERESKEREEGAHATQTDAVPGPSSTQAAPPVQGATGAVPPAELIGIEDFARVDLRVGEILTAERVPKSDKLLRFTIDLGEGEPRQILAGIAGYYEPEKLIGKKVIVVANLKPRKLRGFESQGMVLAASVGPEDRPVLATFTEEVPNGAKLK